MGFDLVGGVHRQELCLCAIALTSITLTLGQSVLRWANDYARILEKDLSYRQISKSGLTGCAS